MSYFAKQCVKLRNKDLSINEIVEITGHGKSSIYPHIKGMPLSKKRQERVRQINTERLINYNKKRRGVSSLGRHPKKFGPWTPETTRLVGHLLFDGEINERKGCVYTNGNTALIEKVRELMKPVYEYEPRLIESIPGVFRVSYFNVELGSYLNSKRVELLSSVEDMPRECKRSFLKAFFNDEGSVYFIAKKRLVRGYQHSPKILRIVQNLLEDFSIESKVDEKFNEIIISRKENLVKFRDEVNFSPGVKINGKRANSVWKKDLEKRKILDMAIDSYQS